MCSTLSQRRRYIYGKYYVLVIVRYYLICLYPQVRRGHFLTIYEIYKSTAATKLLPVKVSSLKRFAVHCANIHFALTPDSELSGSSIDQTRRLTPAPPRKSLG